MAMSRKDYVAMAAAIREVDTQADDTARTAVASVVRNLMTVMYEDNRRFDGVKFITACGLDDKLSWHEGFSYKEARLVVG